MINFETYQSPFGWRYGSPAMRAVWSEHHKRLLWRKIWVALARVQSEFDLVTPEQVEDLEAHQSAIDIPRALEIENEIQHDLMAEVRVFASQCPVGGGIIHLGATSMDIEDNADAVRLRESLELLLIRLNDLLAAFADKIEQWADQPLIAFTHMQPAEPSTLGYRLSLYAQDLLADWQALRTDLQTLRGKGFKGAVGTGAAYMELLGAENYELFEERLSELMRMPFYPICGQTTPRKQEYNILCDLAGLAQSLSKFAFDLRILQSQPIGELAEPFGRNQVGSSAMPFKRNPILCEKVNSLSRSLAQMPRQAWDNASFSLLERTLDDSADRRTLLPEAFLIADELLTVVVRIVRGLQVRTEAIQRNLETYAPFAGTERILMEMVKAGANRQEMHEVLRQHTLASWEAMQRGEPNPLLDRLAADPVITHYLPAEDIKQVADARRYTGAATRRATEMAVTLRNTLSNA